MKKKKIPAIVGCTHLDHMNLAERVKQVEHIMQILEESCKAFENDNILLMGDFNAIQRKDYTLDEWNALVTRHHSNGWMLSENSTELDKIKNIDAGRELLDCFDYHHECNNAFVHELQPEEKFTAHSGEPLYRIDYIFASRNFINLVKVAHAFVSRDFMQSDHFPLFVDFMPDAKL